MKKPITPYYILILEKLLSVQFKGRDELIAQMNDLQYESTEDEDNYGSIYLHTDVKEKAEVSTRVPVEGLFTDSDGGTVDILLHVVDGYLNELEIVKFEDTPLKVQIDSSKIEVHLNT